VELLRVFRLTRKHKLWAIFPADELKTDRPPSGNQLTYVCWYTWARIRSIDCHLHYFQYLLFGMRFISFHFKTCLIRRPFVEKNMYYLSLARVSRCLTEKWQVIVWFMANFWRKNFENGGIFGNTDISLQNGNFWKYWFHIRFVTLEPTSNSAVLLNLSWFVAPFQRLSTLVAPCSSIKKLF